MLISALMIGFCSAYAHAATPVWLLRAKAGIASAMLAANLILEPIQIAELNAVDQAIDPLNIVQTIGETQWGEYIDRSTIVVRPDKVTIDGVDYSEIWLGPEATDKLRLAGFDFTTAYNIVNNQSTPVSYADGVGYIEGLPAFDIPYSAQQPYQTQHMVIEGPGSYDVGDTSVVVTQSGTRYPYSATSSLNGQKTGNPTASSYPRTFFYAANSSNMQSDHATLYSVSNDGSPSGTSIVADTVLSPFSYDYVSGVIDAPIDPEDGILLRVPSEYDDGTGASYNYDIHDLINIYPQVDDTNGHDLIFDPTLNPDFQTDIDMGNALGDIISAVILAKLLDLLGDDSDVIYAPMPDKDDPDPEPGIIDPLPDPDPAPDDPVPGTTIANTDWTKLDEILRWIQSTIDSIRHLTEALQTMLDSIFDAIQSVIQSIRELADKILEDIELGPAKLFDKALDILKTLFLPLLLPIRAMMNLWHYVVEWVQSVSSPFTWIFGIMIGTSYNMVLPIYALLAGGICISIYKALGR